MQRVWCRTAVLQRGTFAFLSGGMWLAEWVKQWNISGKWDVQGSTGLIHWTEREIERSQRETADRVGITYAYIQKGQSHVKGIHHTVVELNICLTHRPNLKISQNSLKWHSRTVLPWWSTCPTIIPSSAMETHYYKCARCWKNELVKMLK